VLFTWDNSCLKRWSTDGSFGAANWHPRPGGQAARNWPIWLIVKPVG
jgi:hypothetical protein